MSCPPSTPPFPSSSRSAITYDPSMLRMPPTVFAFNINCRPNKKSYNNQSKRTSIHKYILALGPARQHPTKAFRCKRISNCKINIQRVPKMFPSEVRRNSHLNGRHMQTVLTLWSRQKEAIAGLDVL